MRRAFTLMELLLVIIVIAVLAAIAWPNFGQAQRAENLDETARRLKAVIAMCRAQAMNEATRYRITFQLDGQVKVTHQRDPQLAPNEYTRVRDSWADLALVLDNVWVEAVRELPNGPPPILVKDELIEFPEDLEEPLPLAQLERPVDLDIAPDGSAGSARWILRDDIGRGRKMTLDGRLGRVDIVSVDSVRADELVRPKVEAPSAAELEAEQQSLKRTVRRR